MKQRPPVIIDPYFNDVPWEIIYDDKGRVLGEVFRVPLEKRPKYPRKRKGAKVQH